MIGITFLCACFHVCFMYSVAMPCSLHRLPSHSAATLHLPSRGRWTPPGCWWECKVAHKLHLPGSIMICLVLFHILSPNFVCIHWNTQTSHHWHDTKHLNVFYFSFRETSERTISTQLCRCWETQGILGAAAEGASGTQEDGKAALKVCMCVLSSVNCVNVFTQLCNSQLCNSASEIVSMSLHNLIIYIRIHVHKCSHTWVP